MLPVRALTNSLEVERKGSGFDPSQTETIVRPRTRALTPFAMVSTSGSSGIDKLLLPHRGLERVRFVL